jgi:hypothetical protein
MRPEVREARLVGRGLIAVAITTGVLMFFLLMAAPGDFRPMFYEPPWYVSAIPLAGICVWTFGLAWMIRIYRANSEPGERTWRYRS